MKKTNYNTKISENENKFSDHGHNIKYITTLEFSKLTKESFKARLVQVNLDTKTDFDAKLKDISKRITSNKSKHLLVENKLKKTKNF